MDAGLNISLEDIFARQAETSASGAIRADDVNEIRFVAAFVQKREAIVRPVMQMIGEYLVSKGYEFEILSVDDGLDPAGRNVAASITLAIVKPPRCFSVYEYPSLAVVCDKGARRVRFEAQRSWPGCGRLRGPAGSASLDEVTADTVQEQILKVLSELFNG